ncbi:MAG: hypothetical protein QOI10_2938 [Solirubrobacterales bacterium]|nr:hypothetical protein [Solirubrobacterales bacterium]
MSAGAKDGGPLAEFARAHGLAAAERVELPRSGGLLSEDDLRVEGAASGDLPGGEPGTVCRLTYTYRSNDSTHTVRRTAVVLHVPESIGFAPYLGAGGPVAMLAKSVKLESGDSVRAADGVNADWLTELFSPAFTEWLHRNPDDFGWELAAGVLCVSREGYLSAESELETLCTDAAHIATTVREECLEEVDTGEAKRTAAKDAKPEDPFVAAILAKTTFDHPPADVASTRPQFRQIVVRHPSTYIHWLGRTLLWMLGVNIIGGGIYGLLLNLSNPGRAVLIYQGILFVIIGYLVLRSQINGSSQKLATEGFWQQYARDRNLTFEDPSTFAATHAKANLPGAPVRVMTGTFSGIPGSLMTTGDGFKRGDSIALVGGEDGPTATAELDVSAPGISASALDQYAADLALDLKTRP